MKLNKSKSIVDGWLQIIKETTIVTQNNSPAAERHPDDVGENPSGRKPLAAEMENMSHCEGFRHSEPPPSRRHQFSLLEALKKQKEKLNPVGAAVERCSITESRTTGLTLGENILNSFAPVSIFHASFNNVKLCAFAAHSAVTVRHSML